MLWLTLEGLSYTDRAVVCVCCCGDRGLTKIIENVTGIETMGHLCVPIEDSDFGLVTELRLMPRRPFVFLLTVFITLRRMTLNSRDQSLTSSSREWKCAPKHGKQMEGGRPDHAGKHHHPI
jgi:hypothetical protein